MIDFCSKHVSKIPASTGTEKLSSNKEEPTNSLNAPAHEATKMGGISDADILDISPPPQPCIQECINTQSAHTSHAALVPATDLPFGNRKFQNFHIVPTFN